MSGRLSAIVRTIALSLLIATPALAGDCIGKHLQPFASQEVARIDDFKLQYGQEFSAAPNAHDNEQFVRFAKETPDKGYLFFESENPILKDMNDRIFRDKSLSTSVTNKYKEIFFRNLGNPRHETFDILRREMAAKYSDYKTIRLGFAKDTPEIRSALQKLYAISLAEYSNYFRRLNLVEDGAAARPFMERIAAHDEIALRPENWQLAGIGSTADEAGISARVARERFRDTLPRRPRAEDFDSATMHLSHQLEEAEMLRANVQKSIPRHGGILTPSARFGSSRMILSQDTLEILRKARAYDADPIAYTRHVQKRILGRFKTSLSREQVLQLREYFNLSETFSPGLYHISRSGIPLKSATQGIVSVDFAGLGAKNAATTLDAIIPSPHEAGTSGRNRVSSAMKRAKMGLEGVSSDFENLKNGFREAIRTITPEERVFFSGDDGAFIPRQELGPGEKRRLLLSSAEKLGGDARIVFLPKSYRGTGRAIGSNECNRLIAEGESVEKEIKILLNTPSHSKSLKDMLIAVDYVPNSSSGEGVMHIYVAGQGTRDSALMTEVKRAFHRVMADRASRGMRPGNVSILE